MSYLVLYHTKIDTKHRHYEPKRTDEEGWSFYVATYKKFEGKREAIDFATLNNGVIVEAFDFDIKKNPKKDKQ